MAWYNFKQEDNKPRTLGQLTAEEKEELTQLMLDGAPVSELAQNYNLSPQALYILRRSNPLPNQRRTVGNPDVERIRQEIEKYKAEAELEKVREELEYQRELRKLTLEEKRLEIEARRAELEDDDEDFDIEDAANNPENMLLQIVARALANPNRSDNPPPLPQTPAPPPAAQSDAPFDVTKELDAEEVRFYIKSFHTPEEIAMAQLANDETIRNRLKSRFPAITENNINTIIKEIRHYGKR